MKQTPKLKRNDRVLLLKTVFEPTRGFPLKGSKYECKGTVLSTTKGMYKDSLISVLWDNGFRRHFGIESLELVNESPERCESIW